MLTLGNADAPAGKIFREGNHRHVTHTLIDCKHTLPFCHVQDKDQNKEEKLLSPAVISSKSGPVVVHALALAVFHRWVTCSLPAISKYHFSSKVTYCTFPCTLILVNSPHEICSSSSRVRFEDFSTSIILYILSHMSNPYHRTKAMFAVLGLPSCGNGTRGIPERSPQLHLALLQPPKRALCTPSARGLTKELSSQNCQFTVASTQRVHLPNWSKCILTLHWYCKSLPFFYFLTFEKADCSIFTLSVGWSVGWSTSPLIFSIYKGIKALY